VSRFLSATCLSPFYKHYAKRSKLDAELARFADDLLQSVREMNSNVRARETKVALSQVLEVRNKTGLSQQQFASVLHISKRTL
jgi:putative transcriptional regulator